MQSGSSCRLKNKETHKGRNETKKSLAILTGAALLLSVSATAKVRVSKYSITINEPVTAQNTAAAAAEFQKTGGTNPSLTLAQCDDAGLAAAVKAFPKITKLTIQKSPKLSSIEALKTAPLTTLSLDRLPALADLAPLASIKTLRTLSVDQVGFKNPDLSFCANLPELNSFSLRNFPATLKTISGIDKCPRLNQLLIANNQGPLDLAPLANFKKMRRLSLKYVNGLDLTPVTRMPALIGLDLYGARNLDLAPLAACPKLKEIMIYATKGIKDYNVLANIKTLENVHAGLTPMNDLSWAPQLPNLKKVSLFAENFKTFAPLGECRKLEKLTFWSMKGTVDIAQFANGSAPLKELSFAGSTIVNEAKLADLAKTAKLTSLNLDDVNRGKRAIDISFLEAFPQMKTLNLRKAKVTSLEPVTKLTKLKKLTLDKPQKAQLAGKLPDSVYISAY